MRAPVRFPGNRSARCADLCCLLGRIVSRLGRLTQLYDRVDRIIELRKENRRSFRRCEQGPLALQCYTPPWYPAPPDVRVYLLAACDGGRYGWGISPRGAGYTFGQVRPERAFRLRVRARARARACERAWGSNARSSGIQLRTFRHLVPILWVRAQGRPRARACECALGFEGASPPRLV
jgi:hypothetical protein